MRRRLPPPHRRLARSLTRRVRPLSNIPLVHSFAPKMPSISYIVAGAAAIASVQASGYCDPDDCDPSSSQSAFSICNNALTNGVFADWIVPASMSAANLTSYCLGFCEDGSRADHFSGGIPGAVWDICAG